MISFCAAGVELEQLAMLHLSYESCCACTAIVCAAADSSTKAAEIDESKFAGEDEDLLAEEAKAGPKVSFYVLPRCIHL